MAETLEFTVGGSPLTGDDAVELPAAALPGVRQRPGSPAPLVTKETVTMNTLTPDSTAAVIAAAPCTCAYTCPVPHILEAVGTVRRRAQTVLAAWGTPRDTAEDVLLVISELVTNAVVHALPPAELRLSLSRTDSHAVVRIEVADAGAAPAPDFPDNDPRMDEHGRGNAIVLVLAARSGTHRVPGEVVRWAELPTG